MAETAWSPGPLRAEPVGEGQFREPQAGDFMLVTKDRIVVAIVWEYGRHGKQSADLLAAAPALYEALAAMVDPDDGHIAACGNGGEDSENCSPLCVRVRAALRLARGEEPTP